MKVCFADIDGVLANYKTYNKRYYIEGIKEEIYRFSQESVSAFNIIIQETEAKIVLSSSWRMRFKIDEMNRIFDSNGIHYDIMDYTERINTRGDEYVFHTFPDERTNEIKTYLSKHKDIENFIVLDDMLMDAFKDNMIWTNEFVGLTKSQAMEAIKILNKE